MKPDCAYSAEQPQKPSCNREQWHKGHDDHDNGRRLVSLIIGLSELHVSLRRSAAGAGVQRCLPFAQQPFRNIHMSRRAWMRRLIRELLVHRRYRVVGAAARIAAVTVHIVCHGSSLHRSNDRSSVSFQGVVVKNRGFARNSTRLAGQNGGEWTADFGCPKT